MGRGFGVVSEETRKCEGLKFSSEGLVVKRTVLVEELGGRLVRKGFKLGQIVTIFEFSRR